MQKYKLKLKCKSKGEDLIITQEEYRKQLDNPFFIRTFRKDNPNMVGVIVDDKNILHEVILESLNCSEIPNN